MEVADDLALRAYENALAAERKVIRHWAAADTRAVDVMVRALKASGFDTNPSVLTEDASPPTATGPQSKRKAATQARIEKMKSQSHKSAKDEAAQEGNENWVPSQYTNLGSLSLTLLMWILSAIEPFSLSLPNLRARSGKMPGLTKQGALEILELMCGVSGGYELTDALRYWPFLLSTLSFFSGQRGRRAQYLKLPVNWVTDGIWLVVPHADKIQVKHRFLEKTFDVAFCEMPPEIEADGLYVKPNFSEETAKLLSSRCASWPGFRLALLLNDHIKFRTLQAPSPPSEALKRMALCDLPAKPAKDAKIMRPTGGLAPICDGGGAHGSELGKTANPHDPVQHEDVPPSTASGSGTVPLDGAAQAALATSAPRGTVTDLHDLPPLADDP